MLKNGLVTKKYFITFKGGGLVRPQGDKNHFFKPSLKTDVGNVNTFLKKWGLSVLSTVLENEVLVYTQSRS